MTPQDAPPDSDTNVDRRWIIGGALLISLCVAAIAIAGALFLVWGDDKIEDDNSRCVLAIEARNEAMRAQVNELGEDAIVSDGVPLECLQ